MAAMRKYHLLVLVLISSFYSVKTQFQTYKSTINYVTLEECNQLDNNTKQFFDVSKLACVRCSQSETFQTTRSDGKSGHVRKFRISKQHCNGAWFRLLFHQYIITCFILLSITSKIVVPILKTSHNSHDCTV